MSHFNFSSYYLNSKSSSRLIRYDIIKITDDHYLVKAFDLQQQGIAQPGILLEIEEFNITKEQWKEEHQIGSLAVVRTNMAPSFESTLLAKCQKHRDGIE